MPISVGALTRVTFVRRDGRDFPIGLELGPFGTNLSDKPAFSLVGGLGLSIPVLNPGTVLQASFNFPAWVEYAPSRAGRGEPPVAFLFGPSFSVGRLATTL